MDNDAPNPRSDIHRGHYFTGANVVATLLVGIATQKWGAEVPNWLFVALCLVPVALWLAWFWTHPKVKKYRWLVYTYPRMSFTVMVLLGMLTGGLVSFLLWRTAYTERVSNQAQPAPIVPNAITQTEQTQPTATPASVFHLTIGPIVSFFPEQFVYVYDFNNKQMAPVWLLINLKVTNNRPTATKIRSYVVDIGSKTETKWARVYNVPMGNPLAMYWRINGNLKTCGRLYFARNSFDLLAESKTLQPGESVEGWTFFEWPAARRGIRPPEYDQFRIRIENSQEEKETFVLDAPKQEPGESGFGGGSLVIPPDAGKTTDLSSFTIRPMNREPER